MLQYIEQLNYLAVSARDVFIVSDDHGPRYRWRYSASSYFLGRYQDLAELSGLPFGEAPARAVEEKPAVTWLSSRAVPVRALRMVDGGGGAGVWLAQGALVTPSTIPTGGLDAGVAQGAALPGAKFDGFAAAEGGNVLPAFTVCLDPIG